MKMQSIGNWARHAVLAAVLGVASVGAQAAPSYGLSAEPLEGAAFELTWFDDVIPVTGFTETDVVLAFDPTKLELLGISAGSAFNPVNISAVPAILDDPLGYYPGWTAYTYFFQHDSTAASPLSYGEDILSLQFKALAAGETSVLFFGLLPLADVADIPGYYGFASAVEGGSAIPLSITAVPEPTTVALLLAGLGVVAGAATRRRAAVAVNG